MLFRTFLVLALGAGFTFGSTGFICRPQQIAREEILAKFDRGSLYLPVFHRFMYGFQPAYDLRQAVTAEVRGLRRGIDIGGGTGLQYWHLRNDLPQREIAILEPSLGMIEEARKSVPECDLHHSFAEDLKMFGDRVKSGSQDFAILVNVEQFLDIEQKVAAFREIARVLRTGGVVVVSSRAAKTDDDARDGLTHLRAACTKGVQEGWYSAEDLAAVSTANEDLARISTFSTEDGIMKLASAQGLSLVSRRDDIYFGLNYFLVFRKN